jgi:hypothetical protein
VITVSLDGTAMISSLRIGSRTRKTVHSTSLAGRTILIAEDEPFIAMDIAAACETAGAVVLTAATLDDAARLVEHELFRRRSWISASATAMPIRSACG